MAATQSPKTARPPPRSRKSIAHIPSSDVDFDKENATTALAASAIPGKSLSKKSRSKSLGLDDLDALTEGAGNKRKARISPAVKSILKPSIPISPPKPIPAYPKASRQSPGKGRAKANSSPRKKQGDESLVDTSVLKTDLPQSGLENVENPFNVGGSPSTSPLGQKPEGATVRVNTEEEQQEVARARQKQDIIDRRDARRKSLANRRVSFAPEATLHTWDVIEMPEDSTTSSANSSRRASGITTGQSSPHPKSGPPSSDPIEAPSTPPKQVDEVQVTAFPAHQRDAHQKKRRRSSGIPPMNFNNPDDYSSSPIGSTASDDTASRVEVSPDARVDSSSDSGDDVTGNDSTITRVDVDDEESPSKLDVDDDTVRSGISTRSSGGSSTGSSGRLEAALRQAADQAGTHGIDFDENGDLSMEFANDEVTAAFQPFVKKGKYSPKELVPMHDQENINPFSPAFRANLGAKSNDEEAQDETMDMTRVGGAILTTGKEQESPAYARQKSNVSNRRRSSVGRRRSSGDGPELADETMEITTAIGDIQQPQGASRDEVDGDDQSEEDEMTMDFTAVVGGVSPPNGTQSQAAPDLASQQLLQESRRDSTSFAMTDDTMDMTMAVGGILDSITERTEPNDDQTFGMDVTTAIGKILPMGATVTSKAEGKAIMEREAESGDLAFSPSMKPGSGTKESLRHISNHLPTLTSETGSPSFSNTRSRSHSRKGTGLRQSMSPNKASGSSPVKKPATPSKQVTPKVPQPTTPGKTPPSKNVAMRTGSPKKLFKTEIKEAHSNPKTPKPSVPSLQFGIDPVTGQATPSIQLTPQRRKPSELEINKSGLGSPRAVALLDRRASIGDSAETFAPVEHGTRGVRFEDPRIMAQEIELERVQDQRRESGRGILQQDADIQDEEEENVTANLRDMIESLTPKKNKLKGRKSLHVGAAKGLLGKRPAELDRDEDEATPSPKRLKGRQQSPVKNIKLPAPPSKMETTGRVLRAPRFSLGGVTGNVQPLGTPTTEGPPNSRQLTPKDQSRFKDVEVSASSTKPMESFEQKLDNVVGAVDAQVEDDERIHLQDFLNMTSIRFMELTTTKRRHTAAPKAGEEDVTRTGLLHLENGSNAHIERELEDCVVAGACTVPMLELYQHSCRELKKYISEGRSIVHEIEHDTFEENPPLFREYMSAAPEVRSIMDNQFKNVKTHARLLSKAMWYEWRMKLLDGLREGLLRIEDGFQEDDVILSQQMALLQPIIPDLITRRDTLEKEREHLQIEADALADCDQNELMTARESLSEVDTMLEERRKVFTNLQEQHRPVVEAIPVQVEQKQRILAEIKDAEKVLEECRGWTGAEITGLIAKVSSLEELYGWSIASASSGSALIMTYRSVLDVFFTPSAFLQSTASGSALSQNAPISLTYVSDTPLSTEKRFFLQIIRARLQSLPQRQTSVKTLLNFIERSWEQAESVAEHIRRLRLGYITEVSIKDDETLAVSGEVLCRSMRSKVSVGFEVVVAAAPAGAAGEECLEAGLKVDVKTHVKVIYGETLNEGKMGEFLTVRIKGKKGAQVGSWANGVGELEEKLLSRKGKSVGVGGGRRI